MSNISLNGAGASCVAPLVAGVTRSVATLKTLNQLVPTVQAAAVTDQIAHADSESRSVLTDLLSILRGRSRSA
ncbi:hypothetical protein ACFWVP_19955 [Streptomyces sp. NPDC058637]|uniref:hypothetical protein n=1 Tax=Streptomyces sp. NPDC058637 TaxID=3346569 RepID=UPI003648C8EB